MSCGQPRLLDARRESLERWADEHGSGEVAVVQRHLDGQPAADQDVPELVRLVERRRPLDADIATDVNKLRRPGASWTVVGAALGTSRQGARQRYGKADQGQ